MRTDLPGIPEIVPGSTPGERAANFAGLLAEHGTQQITLTTRETTQTLSARITDLPGELLTHTPCTLLCSAGEYSVSPEQIRRIAVA